MASSVVSASGEYRHDIRIGAMEFDALVIFTEEPPIGEEYFTVVAKKELIKLPVGIIPDGRMSDSARLKVRLLEFKGGKGRAPRVSSSYVFSRVERGKKENKRNNMYKNPCYCCLSSIVFLSENFSIRVF